MYNWYSIRAGAGSYPSAGKFTTINLNVFGSPPGKDWLPKISAALFVVIYNLEYTEKRICFLHSSQPNNGVLVPLHSISLVISLTLQWMDGLFPSALTSLATSKIIIMLAIVHNISENYVKNHWMTKPNPNNRDDPFPHPSPSALTTSLWLNAGWDDDDAIKPKALHSQMYNTIGILVMSWLLSLSLRSWTMY